MALSQIQSTGTIRYDPSSTKKVDSRHDAPLSGVPHKLMSEDIYEGMCLPRNTVIIVTSLRLVARVTFHFIHGHLFFVHVLESDGHSDSH